MEVKVTVDEEGRIKVVTDPPMNLVFAVGLLEAAKKLMFDSQMSVETDDVVQEEIVVDEESNE
jgi:hypothetical protein